MEKITETQFWTNLKLMTYRNFNKCKLSITPVTHAISIVSHSDFEKKVALLLDIDHNTVTIGDIRTSTNNIEIPLNNSAENTFVTYYHIYKEILHYFWKEKYDGHTWTVGDNIIGKNYTDLVNQLTHTKHKMYVRSFGWLNNFGNPNTIFWIVRMDGSINGQTPEELWRNTLHDNNNMIVEEFINREKIIFEKYSDKGTHFYPYRFAFAKDKTNTFCEFLGLYRVIKIDRTNFSKTFERVDTKLTMYFPHS